jgi:peptidoglycan/LPS O-acetylase OafA/YrhL
VHELLTILWVPIDQFWFLYALFFFHLAAMITSGRLKWLLPAAFITAVHFSLPPQYNSDLLAKIEYMFPFFVLGIFLGQHRPQISIKPQWIGWALSASAAAYALSVYGFFASPQISEYPWTRIPVCLTGICLVLALSQWIVHLSSGPLTRFLTGIGAASMVIYILHILVGSGTRVFLKLLGIRNFSIHLALGVILGIFVPVLATKVVPKKWMAYVGLAPFRFITGQPRPPMPTHS